MPKAVKVLVTGILGAVGFVMFSASTCSPPPIPVELKPSRAELNEAFTLTTSITPPKGERGSIPAAELVATPAPTVRVPPDLRASVSLPPDVDGSGYGMVRVVIGRVKETTTGENAMTDGIGAFDANLAYEASGLTVTGIAITEPFGYLTTNLNAVGGSRTYFNAFLPTPKGPVPPLAVAEVRLRLKGPRDAPYTATLNFATIADPTGDEIRQEAPAQLTFMRGDADNSGTVNIKDAMAIGQYLAGSRELGTGNSALNPVNAASVHHDAGAGDRIDTTDALFIAQMLAGLRDDWYNRP